MREHSPLTPERGLFTPDVLLMKEDKDYMREYYLPSHWNFQFSNPLFNYSKTVPN
jgi:hypothetical protein